MPNGGSQRQVVGGSPGSGFATCRSNKFAANVATLLDSKLYTDLPQYDSDPRCSTTILNQQLIPGNRIKKQEEYKWLVEHNTSKVDDDVRLNCCNDGVA